MEQYKDLPFEDLRTLHREIAALIVQRREEALEELREKASVLGFTAEELAPKKKKSGPRRYRDPENPENTWGGKGKKPNWLTEAISSGRSAEDFVDV